MVTNYSPSASPIDPLNRVTEITHSDGTPTEYFTYDNYIGWGQPHGASIGRLARALILGPSGAEDDLFSYDSMGRINHIESATPSEAGHAAHWTQMEYDLAGNMTRLLYPSGRIVSQGFDIAGRLNSVMYAAQSTPYGSIDGGVSVNRPYISSIGYSPNGSPQSITYGNGVKEQLQQNRRLQTCESSGFLSTGLGGQMVMDRQQFFSATTGTPCQSTAGDNGNIWNIVDGTNSAQGSGQRSQGFTYDYLNRISSWNTNLMSGLPRSQTFGYDSFGNVMQTNGLNISNYAPLYDAKNHLTPGSISCSPSPSATGVDPSNPGYDYSGNVLCTGINLYGAQAYVYDAESRISLALTESPGSNVYVISGSYTYDAQGNRIRKDQGDFGSSQYTEYSWANGQVLAEKDQTGVWTDHIYANGKKIATAYNNDQAIHVSGTASCDNCWAIGSWLHDDASNPLIGYTFKSGDKLTWRQYQSGGAIAGIHDIWTYCGGFTGATVDTDGAPPSQGSAANVWQQRTLDMTAFAGCTVQSFRFGAFSQITGNWDAWFADMALYSSDGSVVPIFHRQNAIATTLYSSQNDTNTTIAVDTTTVPASTNPVQALTTFYLSDHLGTTQMEFAGGGWPVWKGEFSPFGQELDTQPTTNNYKFTGKERDTESGLDYFGARYLGSNMGRWMSPDPSGIGYADAENPQSLNLYAYVNNNPLSFVDPNGMLACGAGGAEPTATRGGVAGAVGSFFHAIGCAIQDAASAVGNALNSPVQAASNAPPGAATAAPSPFQQLWSNYPTYSAYPTSPTTGGQTSIWNHVGGRVGDNGNSGNFVNSCSIRMCQALNASGFKIPYAAGQTSSDGMHNWNFPRLTDLQPFLIKNFGKPKEYSANSWRGQLAGKTGIIYFEYSGAGWSGHAELWNGSSLRNPEEDYSRVSKGVLFWPIQ